MRLAKIQPIFVLNYLNEKVTLFLLALTRLISLVQGVDEIAGEEVRVRESEGKEVNTVLKNNIEGIILKWSYQTEEVLTKVEVTNIDCQDVRQKLGKKT